MTEKLLHLEAVTPQKIAISKDIISFTAPGVEGSFQILTNHAPFITTIIPGKVKIISKDNNTEFFATSGGTVEVHNNVITMLAETIESKAEIDVQRAEAALNRAKIRLKKKEPGTDIERAKIAMLKALARIKVTGSE